MERVGHIYTAPVADEKAIPLINVHNDVTQETYIVNKSITHANLVAIHKNLICLPYESGLTFT